MFLIVKSQVKHLSWKLYLKKKIGKKKWDPKFLPWRKNLGSWLKNSINIQNYYQFTFFKNLPLLTLNAEADIYVTKHFAWGFNLLVHSDMVQIVFLDRLPEFLCYIIKITCIPLGVDFKITFLTRFPLESGTWEVTRDIICFFKCKKLYSEIFFDLEQHLFHYWKVFLKDEMTRTISFLSVLEVPQKWKLVSENVVWELLLFIWEDRYAEYVCKIEA